MKNWRVWLGILVSVLCLYLAARGIDFGGLLQALGHVSFWLLLPAFALVLLGLLGRALRWRVLLYPLPNLDTRRLFDVVSIGYMVNSVFPFRLGDVLRAYLLADLEGLSMVRVLSTLILERIADTLTILFLLLWMLPFISLPPALLRPALGIALLASVAILMLLALATRKEHSLALAERVMTRIKLLDRDWLRRGLCSALDGLEALGSWRTALGSAAWSLAVWLLNALQFFVIMRAMGLRLPFVAALAVLCFTSLGMTVPSSPGYIGVFEYLTVLSLALFGVDKETALGCALVAHALGYVGLIVPGVVAAWRQGYSYTRLRTTLAGMGREAKSP